MSNGAVPGRKSTPLGIDSAGVFGYPPGRRMMSPRFLSLSLPALLAGPPLPAAPGGTNLGFEDGLSGWTHGGVAVVADPVHQGSSSLALGGGFIEQALSGCTPGSLHHLRLAYRREDSAQDWLLGHARIRVDGQVIGEIHNKQTDEFLDPTGFAFIPASATPLLRIESLSASPGLILDDLRIQPGPLPSPPSESWSNLQVMTDARGGRRLVNGSFEAAVADPAASPEVSGGPWNPHISGDALPGWRVTRENIDLIGSAAGPPDGGWVLDTNGHGNGAIAQTITGLEPGGTYTLSFHYARHTSWGSDPMTAELLANGNVAASLVRTSDQDWDDGYALAEVPLRASAAGVLAIELRSTVTDQGGNIAFDDFRLAAGGDAFAAWAVAKRTEADPAANPDRDPHATGFEFLFGLDPEVRNPAFQADPEGLVLPLRGDALQQGFDLALELTRDFEHWIPAGDPASGVRAIIDTSAPGSDGTRHYQFNPDEPYLIWRFELVTPP